ncbi:MAG: hypothetical protein AB1540_13220 [Bdellovibrionota bacterium]
MRFLTLAIIAFLGAHLTAQANESSCSEILVRDYYLANPPRQPKREIGLYVGSYVPTPRIFDSFAEALASGLPFRIFRTEHRDEYNGPSGVLDSLVYPPTGHLKEPLTKAFDAFKKGEIDEAGLQDRLRELSAKNLRKYTDAASLDFEAYKKEISFSAWEKLGGINIAVVADSAVGDKFHVFSDLKEFTGLLTSGNYAIVEQSKITAGRFEIDPSMKADPDFASFTENPQIQWFEQNQLNVVQSAIKLYKKVRKLPRFDPRHVPIIEMQYVDGKVYFLQYHRTRDLERADFALPEKLEEGWVEAGYVRGVTPKDGVVVDVSLRELILPSLAQEFKSRDRAAYVFDGTRDKLISKSTTHHLRRTLLMKPRVSVSVDLEKVVGQEAYNEAVESVFGFEDEGPKLLKVRVVSDGKRAFVRAEPQ